MLRAALFGCSTQPSTRAAGGAARTSARLACVTARLLHDAAPRMPLGAPSPRVVALNIPACPLALSPRRHCAGPYTSRRAFSSDAAASSSTSSSAPSALSKRISGGFSDTRPFPSHARVVIIGGGVVGCSVAFHLAKHAGWGGQVVLLESGALSCGTSWHAAGLIGQMRGTASETQMSGVYGTKLYAELEAETGVPTGFRRVGSLTLARTLDRLTLLKRNAARAHSYGIEAEIISGAEAGALWAAQGAEMVTEDLMGALWLPGDGTATSTDLCASLAQGAKQKGVRIFERARVTGVELDSSAVYGGVSRRGQPRIKGVHTSRGFIEADIIVNCGGQWARQLGAMAGVHVPLHSAEHFYVVTDPLNPPITPNLPVMRDPDVFTYYREWSGGLVMGGFEPRCKPCFTEGPPADFEYALLPDDWDHFSVLMPGALERVPALESVGVRMVNGPESFTPDNQYILGEAPELRNYFVAAGFNSSGIASAGGAGRALADWIVHGSPQADLWGVDIRRFAPFHSAPSFLRDRTFETLGLHYQIPWPRREMESARPARRSALYREMQEAGALFGNKFGWERVNYFDTDFDKRAMREKSVTSTPVKPVTPLVLNASSSLPPPPPPTSPSSNSTSSLSSAPTSSSGPRMLPSFGKPSWLPHSAREHVAARERVALFDQSSFGKILIAGRDAEPWLEHMCAGQVGGEAMPDGKIVYTQLLNEQGGIESDVTLTRLAWDKYLLVTSTAQATRDMDWLRRNLDASAHFVTLTDVSSSFAVLSLMGPNSRALLARCTAADLSNEPFPFATSREIDLGYATVRANRITYVGELGWELLVPVEFAVSVYEKIWAEARGGPTGEGGVERPDLGLVNGGYFAIDSLRLEKGYRAWGHELTPSVTPFEAGLGFAVALGKQVPFKGQAALKEFKAKHGATPPKRLVSITFDDPDAYPLGDEPLYRNGRLVGYLSSAAWGHTLGRGVALAFLNRRDIDGEGIDKAWVEEGKYEVEIHGTRWQVRANLQAPYDPKGIRVKM